MARAMQKDVLIELLSGLRATAALRTAPDALDGNPVLKTAAALTRTVYTTDAFELDFEDTVRMIRFLSARAREMPVNEAMRGKLAADPLSVLWPLTLACTAGLHAEDVPVVILTGGLPGSGKAGLITEYLERLGGNLLIINGDEYRHFHPDYEEIVARYGEESPKYTADFAARAIGLMRDAAAAAGFNILIEGTFRTAEVPLAELRRFRTLGYRTEVALLAVDQEKAWASTRERADLMAACGSAPRAVAREHFLQVVRQFPESAARVLADPALGSARIFGASGLLYDTAAMPETDVAALIREAIGA